MESPRKNKLWLGSFALQATRGLIRDQTTRRQTMFALIVLALICMVGGSTFLESLLDPHVHPTAFIVFWLACAWLTFTALLLALFDVLIVRARGRAVRKAMQEEIRAKRYADETKGA